MVWSKEICLLRSCTAPSFKTADITLQMQIRHLYVIMFSQTHLETFDQSWIHGWINQECADVGGELFFFCIFPTYLNLLTCGWMSALTFHATIKINWRNRAVKCFSWSLCLCQQWAIFSRETVTCLQTELHQLTHSKTVAKWKRNLILFSSTLYP